MGQTIENAGTGYQYRAKISHTDLGQAKAKIAQDILRQLQERGNPSL